MLRAAGVFLVGCLILLVVMYVLRLVISEMTLPGSIGHIALLICGLLGLLAVVYLAVRVFRGGGGPPGGWF